MTKGRNAAVAVVAASLFVAACDSQDILACTASRDPGIHVTVLDSVTSAPLHLPNIRGIATAESLITQKVYADTAFTIGADNVTFFPLFLAYEEPGIFTVTVDAPGYRTWNQKHVLVKQDQYGCHVVQVELEARLQPIG